MGKRYKNLLQEVASYDNLTRAANRAFKGSRKGFQSLNFMEHIEVNCELLSRQLLDGSYRPGNPKVFKVFEPKKRTITALPFRDRVVQQAVHSVISPIFVKTFCHQSYGCIEGKGTHTGAIRFQKLLRSEIRKGKSPWVVKTDFSGYFYNIDRQVLYKEIKRKIHDQKLIKLLYLFSSENGKGIPIGNLLSQLFANIYGNVLDQWLIHNLKVKNFIRYMDDLVVLTDNREQAEFILTQVKTFTQDKLKLELSKWSVNPHSKGTNFLGYRIFEHHKLIRSESVSRAKRKIRNYRLNEDYEKLRKFLASWKGHISWADSRNLEKNLRICYER